MPTKTKTTVQLQPLVVTTKHKGVFFGYGIPDLNAENIRLEKARMCIYWSTDVKGVPGLAASGPTKNCKISFSVPSMYLKDITAIFEVSPEAVEAWEKAPWS